MDSNDDIAARILASIAALPLDQQADAIHALLVQDLGAPRSSAA